MMYFLNVQILRVIYYQSLTLEQSLQISNCLGGQKFPRNLGSISFKYDVFASLNCLVNQKTLQAVCLSEFPFAIKLSVKLKLRNLLIEFIS